MESMNVTNVPVLIVGAGAAGLATSALLAKHGIRSLLVEKRYSGRHHRGATSTGRDIG
jgi:2-polyprenyl-6-methoxyphenol hydroxylase-like FAD-dependent oxidoreductase